VQGSTYRNLSRSLPSRLFQAMVRLITISFLTYGMVVGAEDAGCPAAAEGSCAVSAPSMVQMKSTRARNQMKQAHTWYVAANDTSSGWAWDVQELKLITATGAELGPEPTTSHCTPVDSGHAVTAGYGPQNVFTAAGLWGGRKSNNRFHVGLSCAENFDIAEVRLRNGGGHFASTVGFYHDDVLVATKHQVPAGEWTTIWQAPAPAPAPTPEACDETLSSADQGAAYRGCQTQTISGKQCQRWDSQTPQEHSRTPTNYPDSGLESNLCRNPDAEPTIWCYTMDPNLRWEACQPLDMTVPPEVCEGTCSSRAFVLQVAAASEYDYTGDDVVPSGGYNMWKLRDAQRVVIASGSGYYSQQTIRKVEQCIGGGSHTFEVFGNGNIQFTVLIDGFEWFTAVGGNMTSKEIPACCGEASAGLPAC